MEKDEVFAKQIEKKFEFDERVATVFDDMLHRSIPYYELNIDLICNYLQKVVKDKDTILDIGCSTANVLLHLNETCPQMLHLKGIDSSAAMIKKAKEKAAAYEVAMQLEEADAFESEFGRNSVVICNYLLQFIRPLNRGDLVQKIYESLDDEGVLVCSEKVVFDDKIHDKKIIDLYYAHKQKQGYSQTEITQKREALENVLIPYTIEENTKMFKQAGFKSVQTLFQWANFVTFVVKK
ncbi:MAG: carboxy-S-adenosyl-L-methionine synthase CmoA [Campylobacterota bacterium]